MTRFDDTPTTAITEAEPTDVGTMISSGDDALATVSLDSPAPKERRRRSSELLLIDTDGAALFNTVTPAGEPLTAEVAPTDTAPTDVGVVHDEPTAAAAPSADAVVPDFMTCIGAPWATNTAWAIGRMDIRTDQKGKPYPPRRVAPAEGGAYKFYTMKVEEPLLDDGGQVVDRTIMMVPLLVPDSLATEQQKLMMSGQSLQIRGRMMMATLRDTRYNTDNDTGGQVSTRPHIKVIEVAPVVIDHTDGLVIQMTGRVQKVLELKTRLGESADHGHYHVVRMQITTITARGGFAQGQRINTQDVVVAVPAALDGADQAIRVGNTLQLEAAVANSMTWLRNGAPSLHHVSDPEQRERLRRRSMDYVVITHIVPTDQPSVTPEERIILSKQVGERRRTNLKRRRAVAATRADSQPHLAAADDGVVLTEPITLAVKPRRRTGTDVPFTGV